MTPIPTKKVRVLPPLFYNSAHVRSFLRCSGGILVCSLGSRTLLLEAVAARCQCSDSGLEPLLVAQPRNLDEPTPRREWTVLFGASELSFYSEYSGAAALTLPRVFRAWCMQRIQSGQSPSRTPLYEDPEGGYTATSEVTARSFPVSKARAKESPSAARRARRGGNRGGASLPILYFAGANRSD